ncbi:hypothetical protein BJX70DRAFT_366677 [Aspergillus crustosus]
MVPDSMTTNTTNNIMGRLALVTGASGGHVNSFTRQEATANPLTNVALALEQPVLHASLNKASTSPLHSRRTNKR